MSDISHTNVPKTDKRSETFIAVADKCSDTLVPKTDKRSETFIAVADKCSDMLVPKTDKRSETSDVFTCKQPIATK
jgi:hypothetical protein